MENKKTQSELEYLIGYDNEYETTEENQSYWFDIKDENKINAFIEKIEKDEIFSEIVKYSENKGRINISKDSDTLNKLYSNLEADQKIYAIIYQGLKNGLDYISNSVRTIQVLRKDFYEVEKNYIIKGNEKAKAILSEIINSDLFLDDFRKFHGSKNSVEKEKFKSFEKKYPKLNMKYNYRHYNTENYGRLKIYLKLDQVGDELTQNLFDKENQKEYSETFSSCGVESWRIFGEDFCDTSLYWIDSEIEDMAYLSEHKYNWAHIIDSYMFKEDN